MQRRQLGSLVEQITQSQKFKQQVRRVCCECRDQTSSSEDRPTFAFEKASMQYNWTFEDKCLPIEGQKTIEEITDLIAGFIDSSMHETLSRQFLNVTNEILVIREQVSQFMEDQEKRSLKLKEQFVEQVESVRKKMVVSQNTNANNETYFKRTRNTLNSSTTSNLTVNQKLESKIQMSSLKKEVEIIRGELRKQEGMANVTQKIIFVEQKMQSEIINLKMRVQGVKQKTEKDIVAMTLKLGQNNNKQFINQEVKRSVKSHLKVYLQEINKCKTDRQQIHQTITRTDKGLQQYFASQLKPLWMLVQGLKRRQEKIEQECNLNNQSFIME